MRLYVAFLICASFVTSACTPSSKSVEKILDAYGYIRLVPPSTEYVPGMLVYRSNYTKNSKAPRSVQIGTLCTRRFSVDLYDYPPQKNVSESVSLKSKIGGRFSLKGSELGEFLPVNISSNVADSVILKINNISIESYSREDLFYIEKNVGPVCREVLNRNIKKDNAFQIERVLRADLGLQIAFKAGVEASVKAAAIKELADLGVQIEGASGSQVTGTGLVYGLNWIAIEK